MNIIKHPFVKSINKKLINDAHKSVNTYEVFKAICPSKPITLQNIETIEKIIQVYELSIVDYWEYAFDKTNKLEERKTFHSLCKECFNLLMVCPIPKNPIEKMMHVLKLLSYAYLSERWEYMNRYLNEYSEETTIKIDSDKWNHRLLINIYNAILKLSKKESITALHDLNLIISKLKSEQKQFEKPYLDSIDNKSKQKSAFELASLYHLAKIVEIVGNYMMNGTPSNISEHMDLHFQKAISYNEKTNNIEFNIILIILKSTFKKMIQNSIWSVAKSVNTHVSEYIKLITKSHKPIFELLYPQRSTIQNQGFLDPTHTAIVVNLPTSSGKTIMAEFRILQAINTSPKNSKIVYVVPTRALVNQITARLRRNLDISPLNIKIEKMSGALEIDSFENKLMSEETFNVLVTTPEKLQLLIRRPGNKLVESMVLAIIDEAHNLAEGSRGLNLEMLLSTIKKDCANCRILLLTPFIPNGDDIAKWLDPQNPKSINLELEWTPNDKVLGMYYVKGKAKNISTYFKPMITTAKTIELDKEITVGKIIAEEPISKIKKNYFKITSLLASQLATTKNFLVVGRNPAEIWKMAALICARFDNEPNLHADIILVQKFIESELGADFPLIAYLKKRVGVHHAGLPDDIKELMEWLMENGRLRILISTTTTAQGINFPVSGILISSYMYPYKKMPTRDFLNLIGRAGRIDQPSVGIVGLAVDYSDQKKVRQITKYVNTVANDLVSVLVNMVNDALKLTDELDLSLLAYYPEWSSFLQYIAHIKNQTQNLDEFVGEIELTLRSTYGYNQLPQLQQDILLNAVKKYAEKLDNKKHISSLSDLTGFAPETIEQTINSIKKIGITQEDWNADSLFSSGSKKLTALVGIMLKDMPEIKKAFDNEKIRGTILTEETISNIISDWISGKEIREIADAHFNGVDVNAITECVRTIYSKVTNYTAWGISTIQKIHDSEFNELPDEHKQDISNLSSMAYYGVNTEEAILMRMYNVPRSISKKIGLRYKNEVGLDKIYSDDTNNVIDWLIKTPNEYWTPKSKNISGGDYKKIWLKLSGK